MFWQSIMADRWLGHDALRRAISKSFDLSPQCIDIVDDITELCGPVPPTPRILVERTRREGHFPLQFDVFVGGDEIEKPIETFAGTLDRAQAISRALQAVLLIGDGPIGHDEQIRVQPDGTFDIVELDGDEMDESRFVILGSRPLPKDAQRPDVRPTPASEIAAMAERALRSRSGSR